MYWAAPVVALRPPHKPVNDVPLTRDLLMGVLSALYECLYRSFWRQVCLVVHGSGVMGLHLAFQHRGYTQDIADTHCSLVREYVTLSFRDVEQQFLTCIEMTVCHSEVTLRCCFASPTRKRQGRNDFQLSGTRPYCRVVILGGRAKGGTLSQE